MKSMGEEEDIQRMHEIASEIEELSKEMRTLVLKYSAKKKGNLQPTKKEGKLVIGCKVMITNKYKGNYGKIGVVVSMNKLYVDIKLENENLVVKKAKTNVKIL